MPRNFLAPTIAVAALALLLPATSHAAVRFCNDFDHTVFVAVAYKMKSGSWYARGWLSVVNGQCSEFNNPPMHVATFLYRAETDDYPSNGGQVREVWGNSEDKKFAVTDDGFAWENADSPTGKPAEARMAGFVDTNATNVDGDLSITVTFAADGSSQMTIGAN
jgi:uncharacterized membrane protein